MEFRPLGAWADEGHLAFKNVPNLGKFIQPGLAEKSAHSCNPRIVFGRPNCAGGLFCVLAHSSKFNHIKGSAGLAYPTLPIKHWPCRGGSDRNHDEREQNKSNNTDNHRGDEICAAFENLISPLIAFIEIF